MEQPTDFGLVKVTEIYLVPSSFLVAALGTADSNSHRASISLLALIVRVLWQISSREALAAIGPAGPGSPGPALPRRVVMLAWLPLVFVVGWLISTVIHVLLWNQALHA